MSHPFQFLLLLDVDQPIDEQAVASCLPDRRRDRRCLRLTEMGVERPATSLRDQLDWAQISSALATLREKLRASWPESGNVEVFVAGFAPLSVFFAVGAILDTRVARVTCLQPLRHQSNEWTTLELSAGTGPDVLSTSGASGEPAESTGHVGVYLSTLGIATPKEQMRAAIQAQGHEVAGIAALFTPSRLTLDAANIGEVLRDLERDLVTLTATYPHRTGVSIFLAGPGCFALAAGLVLNPNQFLGEGRFVDLTEFAGGVYHHSLRLPLADVRSTDIPQDAESRLRRIEALGHFKRGAEGLKQKLSKESVFLPAGFGGDAESSSRLRDKAYGTLLGLRIAEEPSHGEAFDVGLTGTLSVGAGLLHALAALPSAVLGRLGQLFTLHEVLHADQGIESHNYRGIGRAGVVLEDVDFWADAFAVGTAAQHEISRKGPEGEEQSADILVGLIDAHINAMQAFDVVEQGSHILTIMPERRLRRYLIWYLQRARAGAVRSSQDLAPLLNERLVVELAPLRGRLDSRHDKVVEAATPDTTLAFSLGGRAKRVAALPENFVPRDLVDAVRTFNEPAIHRAMEFVVRENPTLLVSWRK